jgi:hypothetical protein
MGGLVLLGKRRSRSLSTRKSRLKAGRNRTSRDLRRTGEFEYTEPDFSTNRHSEETGTKSMTRVSTKLAAVIVLSLAPLVVHAQQPQQQQNKQNPALRPSKNSQQQNQPNGAVPPPTSPLVLNAEGLLPVLPMGPFPRPNGSPNYVNQYINQTVNPSASLIGANGIILQQTSQYISMSEVLAGGNTSNPVANQLSNGGLNGVAQGERHYGKNARGLTTKPSTSNQSNQQGQGQHANPSQGQGQTP